MTDAQAVELLNEYLPLKQGLRHTKSVMLIIGFTQ